MGTVFAARREGHSELCVVKQLHDKHDGKERIHQRFRREAKIIARLDHPNIARLIEAGFEGNRFYIAMELILGPALSEVLESTVAKGERIPVPVSAAIAIGVLDGLAFAHAARDEDGRPLELIHRDLSPRNGSRSPARTHNPCNSTIFRRIARRTAYGSRPRAQGAST